MEASRPSDTEMAWNWGDRADQLPAHILCKMGNLLSNLNSDPSGRKGWKAAGYYMNFNNQELDEFDMLAQNRTFSSAGHAMLEQWVKKPGSTLRALEYVIKQTKRFDIVRQLHECLKEPCILLLVLIENGNEKEINHTFKGRPSLRAVLEDVMSKEDLFLEDVEPMLSHIDKPARDYQGQEIQIKVHRRRPHVSTDTPLKEPFGPQGSNSTLYKTPVPCSDSKYLSLRMDSQNDDTVTMRSRENEPCEHQDSSLFKLRPPTQFDDLPPPPPCVRKTSEDLPRDGTSLIPTTGTQALSVSPETFQLVDSGANQRHNVGATEAEMLPTLIVPPETRRFLHDGANQRQHLGATEAQILQVHLPPQTYQLMDTGTNQGQHLGATETQIALATIETQHSVNTGAHHLHHLGPVSLSPIDPEGMTRDRPASIHDIYSEYMTTILPGYHPEVSSAAQAEEVLAPYLSESDHYILWMYQDVLIVTVTYVFEKACKHFQVYRTGETNKYFMRSRGIRTATLRELLEFYEYNYLKRYDIDDSTLRSGRTLSEDAPEIPPKGVKLRVPVGSSGIVLAGPGYTAV